MANELKDISSITNGNTTLTFTSTTVTSNADMTVPALYLDAQGGMADGGELQLKGAGSYGDIQLDAYAEYTRFGTMATGKGLQIVTSTGTTTIRGDIIVQPGWITPTFQNGFMNYDSTYNQCAYFKDMNGIVHLKGLVKQATAVNYNSAPGLAIFTLPAGYRPDKRQLIPSCTNPNTIGRIDIATDGVVSLVQGNTGWISLDNCTFRVGGYG